MYILLIHYHMPVLFLSLSPSMSPPLFLHVHWYRAYAACNRQTANAKSTHIVPVYLALITTIKNTHTQTLTPLHTRTLTHKQIFVPHIFTPFWLLAFGFWFLASGCLHCALN